MKVDIHTHIFPAAIRDRREAFFRGDSAFQTLYGAAEAKMVGARQLVQMLDEEGVDRAVAFGFPWMEADHYRRNNDYVLEAVARYPDRLTGFCCFSMCSKRWPVIRTASRVFAVFRPWLPVPHGRRNGAWMRDCPVWENWRSTGATWIRR